MSRCMSGGLWQDWSPGTHASYALSYHEHEIGNTWYAGTVARWYGARKSQNPTEPSQRSAIIPYHLHPVILIPTSHLSPRTMIVTRSAASPPSVPCRMDDQQFADAHPPNLRISKGASRQRFFCQFPCLMAAQVSRARSLHKSG